MSNWHELDSTQVLSELEVSLEAGLSSDQVQSRLGEFGKNELVERASVSPWRMLLDQFKGIMIIMLIISAVISMLLHEYTDALVIFVIVVLNALLGFSQEYKAEQAMEALKKLAVPNVKVRRDSHVQELSAVSLVPGDIVLLEAGNSVPADGRLVESVNLRAQEAVLTGESEAVEKNIQPIVYQSAPIAERLNMVYMGTVVTFGRGALVVTETGMRTQLGKIADLVQSVGRETTPLQRRLDQLGKILALASVVIVAIVFSLGLVRGESFRIMFMTAISMAVAAVPEGLPAVVTIALAMGAQRMLSSHALIRKLPAVETLGSVTTICSDKTGTLTENRMTLTVLDIAGNRLDLQPLLRDFSPTVRPGDIHAPEVHEHSANTLLLLGGALCNDARLEPVEEQPGSYSTIGDPTEGALIIGAAYAGIWKDELERAMPRVYEVPFDSERKRMTTVHLRPASKNVAGVHVPIENGSHIAFTKGAVDGLLHISSHVWVSETIEPLTEEWRSRIEKANNEMASKGMRVLGLGLRVFDAPDFSDRQSEIENELVFVGMLGMIDPARPEAKIAVQKTRSAGIRTIMITGDHPLTASYISEELGISENSQVITGTQLAEMSIEELEEKLPSVSVFARVAPEHKLKIVNSLKASGQIVAMTGDGVNDAPALKAADIGVAMGIVGTDVSKEASDMILLDDNFATIVAAIEEGRRIYDNIRKFIRYTMTSNAGEIWVMLAAPFLGMPLPLLPLQILWVNLVTDGLPGLALSLEPAEADTMKRPPRAPDENILGRGMARDILWIGLLMGLVSLVVGIGPWRNGNPAWQTMIFTTLTLAQMGNALAIRSDRYSLFQIGIFSNPQLLGSVLLTLVLQLGLIYLPFAQKIFDTVPLNFSELIICLVISASVFVGVEIFKYASRRTMKA